MMRVHRFQRLALTMTLAASVPAFVLAHGNERGEAKATIGGANVAITYGRPMLKGRDMMKMIQPGQLWRIGADVPTTLESDRDLDFAGTRIPKGKYVLLARFVEPGKWTLVVSTKPAREFNPAAKVAEAPLDLQEAKDPAEAVTISLSENGGRGVIEIAWGTMRLTGSFEAAK